MERISNEKLNAMLEEGLRDENILKNGNSITINVLQELKELRNNKIKYEKALIDSCQVLVENEICPVIDCKSAEPYAESEEPKCYGKNCHVTVFVNYFKANNNIEILK